MIQIIAFVVAVALAAIGIFTTDLKVSAVCMGLVLAIAIIFLRG